MATPGPAFSMPENVKDEIVKSVLVGLDTQRREKNLEDRLKAWLPLFMLALTLTISYTTTRVDVENLKARVAAIDATYVPRAENEAHWNQDLEFRNEIRSKLSEIMVFMRGVKNNER